MDLNSIPDLDPIQKFLNTEIIPCQVPGPNFETVSMTGLGNDVKESTVTFFLFNTVTSAHEEKLKKHARASAISSARNNKAKKLPAVFQTKGTSSRWKQGKADIPRGGALTENTHVLRDSVFRRREKLTQLMKAKGRNQKENALPTHASNPASIETQTKAEIDHTFPFDRTQVLRVPTKRTTRKKLVDTRKTQQCFLEDLLLVCKLCRLILQSWTTARIHCKTHTETELKCIVACKICSKNIASSSAWKVHQLSHTGEKPYVCNTCSKAFASNYQLKQHLRIHTGEKPYVCNTCSKAFTQNSHLKQHLRIHTGEKPYVCSTCGRGFDQGSNLKKHQKTHMKSGRFVCDICDKAFGLRKSLILHQRNHSTEEE